MSTFFGDFADYKARTGFNTDQYWKLNVACKRHLLAELVDRDGPTMSEFVDYLESGVVERDFEELF